MLRQLIVCAGTDPREPQTWSGTPKNLVDAFERQGVEVVSLAVRPTDASVHRFVHAGAPLFLGHGARAFRDYYGYRAAQHRRQASRLLAAFPGTPVLHTDHWWLPAPDRPTFVYRDTPFARYADAQNLGRFKSAVSSREIGCLKGADHVFTTSEWARDDYIASGILPDRVTAVGTGVKSLASSVIGSRERYRSGRTLCVAKVRHYDKGLDLLIEGFSRARSQSPDLTLDIVAPLAQHQAGRDGIRFHHDLAWTSLVELYESAAIFAMPARYEPWGLVYLEAMSAGLPCLGSDRAAFPEIIGHGSAGFIVPELTPSCVAQALLEAHKDADRLQRMGSAGIGISNKFSWDETASVILDEIERVA